MFDTDYTETGFILNDYTSQNNDFTTAVIFVNF